MSVIKPIKDQIKSYYPGLFMDLSKIKDEMVAKKVLFLATHGLNDKHLKIAIPKVISQVENGWGDMEITKYWNGYLDTAGDFMFRPGYQRLKSNATLFERMRDDEVKDHNNYLHNTVINSDRASS